MNKTNIEWVQNPDGTQGYTLNSKTGCLNACPYCYARKLAHGRLMNRYLSGGFVINEGNNHENLADPFYPRWWPERLEGIPSGKPKGIFLDDMADWMADYWPSEWTAMEIQAMKDHPQHRFYTLTKQPQNLVKWSPFPDNCWVGVTATNPKMADDAGYYLTSIHAKVKFLSCEPLLGEMKLFFNGLDWLIIGACSGRHNEILELCHRYPDLTPMPFGTIWTAQPPFTWVREIVEAADRVGVKVFLKDNLRPLILDALAKHQIDRAKYLVGRELRQEMPHD